MCDFPALLIEGLQLPTNVDLQNRTASIGIPESFIAGALTSCLDSTAGGRIKESKFQRIDLDFESIDFVAGGISVVAGVRGQFRELLFRNPITGAETFTPFLDVSGTFRGVFNVALQNEILSLTFREADFNFDGPLRDLGDFIVDLFKNDPRVKDRIQNELNAFNGLNVLQLFKKLAPANIQNQLSSSGLSDEQIQSIFDQIQLDAGFTDLELRLTGRW
jgi:hypothetical protein